MAVFVECEGVVVVAAHRVFRMLPQPGNTLHGKRTVVHEIAAKGDGVEAALSLQDRLERWEIAVNVR